MRILGIEPNSKGVGYAVLENNDKLVYWGVKYLSKKRENWIGYKFHPKDYLNVIENLIEFYKPDALILEDAEAKTSRRGLRIKSILNQTRLLAAKQNVPTYAFSRPQLISSFSDYDLKTKHDIAVFLARLFPELEHVVPKKRKPWMSETPQLSIFVALAHCIAYFEKIR